MAEIETTEPNAYITEQLGELNEANRNGSIRCLVMIVFRTDGTSSRLIHGNEDPLKLMGSIELLKGFVTCQEYANSEKIDHADAERRSLN